MWYLIKHRKGNTNSPELSLINFLLLTYYHSHFDRLFGFQIFFHMIPTFFMAELLWISSYIHTPQNYHSTDCNIYDTGIIATLTTVDMDGHQQLQQYPLMVG